MLRWWCFFLSIFLVSCDFFLSREEQTQRLVNEELLTIDWNDVDQYPLFENCDETTSKTGQRECFQRTMLSYLNNAFKDLAYEVENDLADTLYIDLLIDEHGFITLLEVDEGNSIQQIPNFGKDVGDLLNDLTTVAPALKRGVPVSVRVRLPLVLNTGN